MTNDTLERAIDAAFPGRTVDLIEPQTVRPGNRTAFVTFATGEPAYVKTATDTTTRLVRETAATRYAGAHCPVEVPRVLAADPDGDPPYLATEPLPGTVLDDPWTGGGDRERLLRKAGSAIASVHEARFDRAGVIAGGDAEALDLAGESWTETLVRTVEWRAADWYPDRFDDLPGRLVELVRDWDPRLEDVEPALLHSDCSRINVHLDPDGFLDWERALVGDPAFDLVDATGHLVDQGDVAEEDRPDLRAALADGYRERAGSLPTGFEERRPLYWAIAHLLVPQAFDEWSDQVDVLDDELAADVREEFEARVSNARAAIE